MTASSTFNSLGIRLCSLRINSVIINEFLISSTSTSGNNDQSSTIVPVTVGCYTIPLITKYLLFGAVLDIYKYK
ncbi:MAG TPA: hypothetical protein VLA74_06275 [Nitrososphaeraceae archaeon]|nr:hypothetical protein [Nitrososphaeraceae archaeon]